MVIYHGRQHGRKRQRELQPDPARSETPSMRGISMRENREIPWLPTGERWIRWAALGRPEAESQ